MKNLTLILIGAFAYFFGMELSYQDSMEGYLDNAVVMQSSLNDMEK